MLPEFDILPSRNSEFRQLRTEGDHSLVYSTDKLNSLQYLIQQGDTFNLIIIELSSLKSLESYSSSSNYVNDLYSLFILCKELMGESSFVVLKSYNPLHHYYKIIMDSVFGFENFTNEILIDSPVTYQNENSESNYLNIKTETSVMYVYSNSDNATINPQYKNKSRDPYWHTMHSKGQGSAKIFTVDGKKIEISPPIGSHWKFSQERIDKMCEEGTIRINRNGNPMYLVSGKPYIVDNVWIDISSYKKNKETIVSHEDLLERIIQSFSSENDEILNISPTNPNILEQTTRSHTFLISEPRNLSTFHEYIKTHNLKFTYISDEDIDNILTILTEDNQTSQTLLWEYSELVPPFTLDYQKPIVSTTSADLIASFQLVQQSDLSNAIMSIRLNKSDTIQSERLDDYFTASSMDPWKNLLFYGDNVDVLDLLINSLEESIKLIYIDPPYFTGGNEIIDIPSGKQQYKKIAYENQSPTQENSLQQFSQWFYNRVKKMWSLLKPNGFIVVRFDYHHGHYAKLVLDKIFGIENLIGEFYVRRMTKTVTKKYLQTQKKLITQYDNLYIYGKSNDSEFYTQVNKQDRKNQDDLEKIDNNNIWMDINGYEKLKKTLYPTENSRKLLKRVVKLCSQPGDIVADFFCGSGTTLEVAQELARKWIGSDRSNFSINEVTKRILDLDPAAPFQLLSTETIPTKESKLVIDHNTSDGGVMLSILEYSINNHDTPSDLGDIIDFIAIDWDYEGHFIAQTTSYRKIGRGRKITEKTDTEFTHTYSSKKDYRIAIKVVDIFGNFSSKILDIQSQEL